ncbi:hypothetical protein BGW36DRAFT_354148 [Talaromyces proteolyticus]|uniref:Uncharacterized protein n=1 Tax=Talaromyces proteolyticus TaxID=1131652 RepID=A0AAD4L365_9EURO|nr:uncharacterized protein BGW36DRAFT_354148 [Talaromyces proteolyticus]KAH8705750.1 hypothetical protein BGW36DRAFT_354148 [Talaromyces proteolyticus]
MVVSTRQGLVGSSPANGADGATAGKRKTRATRSDSQSNKRRRMGEEESEIPQDNVVVEMPLRRKAAEDDEVPETQEANDESNGIATTDEPQNTASNDVPVKNHIRFDSEEPTPVPKEIDEIPETQVVPPEEESSDDDEAPEVVDNSAQLLSLKVQAQKQEKARKRDENLRKQKRKLQDERNKSQAKATKKPRPEKQNPSATRPSEPSLGQDDDLVSESTATLQGSVVRESGRLALPALLPEEILNAESVYRPPTPEPEQKPKSTKYHKFFDDVEKPVKDLHRGDVTIRVLEDKKVMLPPKSLTAGRDLKAAWMSGQRRKKAPIGLKRVSSRPQGFLRR